MQRIESAAVLTFTKIIIYQIGMEMLALMIHCQFMIRGFGFEKKN